MKSASSSGLCIIGMSPGNSYFKDREIEYLLKTLLGKYGKVGILIADVPAVSTYMALGYPENRARRDKAIPKGNALKNRVRKVAKQLGYSEDSVRIFDWTEEVEKNSKYQESYQKISDLYDHNESFREIANATTRAVLEGSGKKIENLEQATKTAVHYLLSELAFLEFAPRYVGVEKVIYAYHKNWEVYERYISGQFDGIVREHLDFLLLENPYETFNPLWGLEEGEGKEEEVEYRSMLERIRQTGVLRVGFFAYDPAFMHGDGYGEMRGVFYDVIVKIAEKNGWEIQWSEEVGYGVIVDGLREGRFDVFGSTVWPTEERKAEADFSISLYGSPVFAWTRPDFVSSMEELRERSSARVAVKEGDIQDSTAKAELPNLRVVRVPQLSDVLEVLRFVADERADVTFAEPYLLDRFKKEEGGILVSVTDTPVRIFENAFMFRKGESELKQLFDEEVSGLIESGEIRELLAKYAGERGMPEFVV